MATTQTLAGAQSLSEWSSRVAGFIEGCGEASALVAAHIVNGQPISTSELTQTIQSAVANRQTVDAGGAQTAPQVQWDLAQYGVASQVQYGASGLGSRINAALAGGHPVVLGVSNGSALAGEPASLRGHFVTIVGTGPGGYQVADPNTQAAVSGRLVQDTLAQLLAAQPFATITPTGAGAGSVTGTPSGTTLASTSGTSSGNVLNPSDWVSAIQSGFTDAFQRVGLIAFGAAIVLVGLIVLFFSEEGSEAAGDAKAAAPVIEAATA